MHGRVSVALWATIRSQFQLTRHLSPPLYQHSVSDSHSAIFVTASSLYSTHTISLSLSRRFICHFLLVFSSFIHPIKTGFKMPVSTAVVNILKRKLLNSLLLSSYICYRNDLQSSLANMCVISADQSTSYCSYHRSIQNSFCR